MSGLKEEILGKLTTIDRSSIVAAINEINAKTQEQKSQGGIVFSEFVLIASTDGQKSFALGKDKYKPNTDSILVFQNSVKLTGSEYTASEQTLTLVSGVKAGTEISCIVLKNVPSEESLSDLFIIRTDRSIQELSEKQNQVLNEIAAHKNEAMPHVFTNGGVKYKWGFRVANGEPQIVYEEA